MTNAASAVELILDRPEGLNDEGLAVLRDQVGYLSENITALRLTGNSLVVVVSSPVTADDEAAIRAGYDELVGRMVKSFSKVRLVVQEENDGCPTYSEDPMPFLRETRQAVESYPGTFMVRGDLLRVMSALDDFFRSYALSLGADEQAYPTTVPVNSMLENGYIGNFPHHALMVARVHSDLESMTRLAHVGPGEGVPADLLHGGGQMLSPTVCYHCFESLRDQDVATVGTTYTATAHCHRWEGVATRDLERLQTFTMREIVFFGSPEEVLELKARIMEHAADTFMNWGVGFHLMTATDPFFAVNAETKRAFQSMQALKHELRIRLPFSGRTLACGSFNNHKDTLVRPYRISHTAKDKLFSGCVGYGFERMAYGLFAHFGTVLADWPDDLRRDLKLGT